MNTFFKHGRTLIELTKTSIFRTYSKSDSTRKAQLMRVFGTATVLGTICTALYILNNKGFHNNKTQPNAIANSNEKDNTPRTQFNFINKVVEKCAAAVVYVEIKDPRRIDKGTDSASIVSNGSGFIIHESGWILTNAHVVINKPQAEVQVKLHDGSVYTATVEDADMNIDLALIKINTNRKLPALNLAKSGDVYVGEWVVALGSPLSLSHSASAGIVSCVNRAADELGLRNYQMKYIQTDAPITFGNSGGPLVNLDGDVIGINNLRITAGISFAIPIDYATRFLEKIQFGKVREQKEHTDNNLGITTITLTTEMLREVLARHKLGEHDVTHGVLVWKILPNSLANKNGFKVGDIITHVNGMPVVSSNDVYKKLSEKNLNCLVFVIRNGEKVELTMQRM